MITGRDLKLFQQRTSEAQSLRAENVFLRGDRDHYRRECFFADQRIAELLERVERAEAENRRLVQQNLELKAAAESVGGDHGGGRTPPPDFVKASVKGRRKKPGRKKGHPAALRPVPPEVDVHQDAPLPVDDQGRSSCPHCKSCLADLKTHERIVEDIVPAKVVVTAYHTSSGWCPCCRRRVESRAPDQPPASDLPHGQLGINALATAVVLRVGHRLPFRQVSRILSDLPGITVSPGTVARQVQRAAAWLGADYERLLIELRASPEVHADETGWRTDGKNGFVWVLATGDKTLYHVDKSRGGKVIVELLGKAFGGTLVTDFYSAYAAMDCKKQKCLVHLLRELTQTAEKVPAFAAGTFCGKAKRLVKEMLLLKGRWGKIPGKEYDRRVARLEKRLAELAGADHVEANEKRIGKRMRKFRTELTAFLHQENLEGTNNTAERALRPLVVARKISGGSRSRAGADAFAKLASLVKTAGQQGHHVITRVKSLLAAAWAVGTPAVVPK